ncbi:MAG: hypothetical protein AB1645_02890 [Bacillota bacterium]|jgi:hypothetical protein
MDALRSLFTRRMQVRTVAGLALAALIAGGLVGFSLGRPDLPLPSSGPEGAPDDVACTDAPRVVSVSPSPGGRVSVGPDGQLRIQVSFDRAGRMDDIRCAVHRAPKPGDLTASGALPSWFGFSASAEPLNLFGPSLGGLVRRASLETVSEEAVIDLTLDPGALPVHFQLAAVFTDERGRQSQFLWRTELAFSPPDRAGTALAGDPGVEVVCLWPPAGSVVHLPLSGLMEIGLQCLGEMTSEEFGLGAWMVKGDFESAGEDRSGNTATFRVRTYPGKELWFTIPMRARSGQKADFTWPGPILTAPGGDPDPTLAEELHLKAWRQVAAAAVSGDRLARLALYSTRSLAVRHPEIYLRADRLFYRTASTTRGFRELYAYDPETWRLDPEAAEAADKRFPHFLEEVLQTGHPLGFAALDLSRYRVVERRALFPDGAPFLRVIDERAGFLPAVLKRLDGAVSPVEMAFLRYFVSVAKGGPEPFIVVWEDGTASLWSRGAGAGGQDLGWGLVDPATGSPADAAGRRPLIIFNERAVWYPLMGRDDTAADSRLAGAVAALTRGFGAGSVLPSSYLESLPDAERGLISALRDASALGESDVPYAVWAAAKVRYRAYAYAPYREGLAGIPAAAGYASLFSPEWHEMHVLGHTLQVASSRLSPLAAWLAAEAAEDPLTRTRAVTSRYYDLARAAPFTTARVVWEAEFLWYDIEDAVLAKAGTCAIQTGIVLALLDLAEVECYAVWIWSYDGGHEYVYLPALGKEVNNGYLTETEGFLDLEPGSKWIAGLGSSQGFVSFGASPFVSTMPGEEVHRILLTWKDKFTRVAAYGTEGTWTYDEVLDLLGKGAIRTVGGD